MKSKLEAELRSERIAYLRTPRAIREQCDRLFQLACANQLHHFRCDLSNLDQVASYVIDVMGEEYPDLNIPFHSRWRHFEVGNIPRLQELEQKLAQLSPLEAAQAKFDLAMVSVLLDAGAGTQWQYREPETGLVFHRSEGLAVASFRMFCQGVFSSDQERPLRVDAQGLQQLTLEELAASFQVSPANPLLGLAGRWSLLQRLGKSLLDFPRLFGNGLPRPGNLVNYLLGCASFPITTGKEAESLTPNAISPRDGVAGWGMRDREQLPEVGVSQGKKQLLASRVLSTLLEGLGDIWPGGLTIAGINLGDVGRHSALQEDDLGGEYVPFHKLSQWLTYSLLEPLQELGIEIAGLDQLTGLPEYRNGGLCLDLGLLVVKETALFQKPHAPQSEVIVEWRALTLSCLDLIAVAIRQQFKLTEEDLPMVKVLQGGTWTAGRRIAAQLRAGGTSPIQLESDGTVF